MTKQSEGMRPEERKRKSTGVAGADGEHCRPFNGVIRKGGYSRCLPLSLFE
jgi:hypothetical protein